MSLSHPKPRSLRLPSSRKKTRKNPRLQGLGIHFRRTSKTQLSEDLEIDTRRYVRDVQVDPGSGWIKWLGWINGVMTHLLISGVCWEIVIHVLSIDPNFVGPSRQKKRLTKELSGKNLRMFHFKILS